MAFNRGYQSKDTELRRRLVEAAAELLAEEGHHAFSARRVAELAGLKPQLVHYYFRTVEDLLIAVFAMTVEHYEVLHTQALASAHPLRALWLLNSNMPDTSRIMEFQALGVRFEALRAEMQRAGERFRRLQIDAVTRAIHFSGIDTGLFTPAGVVMLMAGMARSIVMESKIGVTMAHDEFRASVERVLDQIEPLDSQSTQHLRERGRSPEQPS